MPTCALNDLRGMEMFLLRNLARHLGVNKWAYKERAELMKEIMALQGEVKSPPAPEPVVTREDKHMEPARLVINTPVPSKHAPKVVEKKPKPEPKKVSTKEEKRAKLPAAERPALYNILMQMARGKETDKEIVVKEAQEVYPEKSRQDILKTWSVVKCHHKKQAGESK